MQKQRLQKYYNTVIVEDLLIVYNYDNIMQLPSLTHATLNTTSKKYLLDKKIAIYTFAACFLLTGQKSMLTRAHKSIAAFNLRAGTLIGCKITLRRSAMYNLLNKLVTFVLPQIGSFQHKQDLFSSARKAVIHIGVKSFLILPEIETFFSLFGSSNEFVGSDTIQGFDITWHFSIPKVRATPRLRPPARAPSSKVPRQGFIGASHPWPGRAFLPAAVSSLLVTAFQYPQKLSHRMVLAPLPGHTSFDL